MELLHSKNQNLEKSRRVSLFIYMTIVMVVSLYAGLHLGVVYLQMTEPNLFGALAELGVHITEHPFELFPADKLMVSIFLFVGVMMNLYLYNEYLKISHTVNDAHGNAAFEDNIKHHL